MASHKPSRWFVPPPTATAYFSRARSPGVVLRVSVMAAPREAAALTKASVIVAMPLNRPRKLRAVRSPVRIARAVPTIERRRPPLPILSPSPAAKTILHAGSSRRNVITAACVPATTIDPLDRISPLASRPAGTIAAVVTSPGPRSSCSASATARARTWGGIGFILSRGSAREVLANPLDLSSQLHVDPPRLLHDLGLRALHELGVAELGGPRLHFGEEAGELGLEAGAICGPGTLGRGRDV